MPISHYFSREASKPCNALSLQGPSQQEWWLESGRAFRATWHHHVVQLLVLFGSTQQLTPIESNSCRPNMVRARGGRCYIKQTYGRGVSTGRAAWQNNRLMTRPGHGIQLCKRWTHGFDVNGFERVTNIRYADDLILPEKSTNKTG